MEAQIIRFYDFGSFRINKQERMLLHNGKPVALPPKVYDTLIALVTHSGRVVGKEQLMSEVWPDTYVEEANLTVNISALRKALGEGQSERQYIETVPKRGYRFILPVTEVSEDSDSLQDTLTEPRSAIEGAAETDAIPSETIDAVRDSFVVKRWGLPLVVLCVLVGLGLMAYYIRVNRAEPRLKVRSIAVLPFKPLVADNRDEPLEMGICDALIMRLSDLDKLIVRPTSSVVQYNKPGQDSVSAGRELGVDALLDGFVQKSGDKIRITAHLVRISDGKHLWSGQFSENFTDIFAVEDSISRQMAEALLLNLTGQEQDRITKHYTDNIHAYELYLMGRYSLDKRTADGVKKSIDNFQRATETDPKYALAFAGLAEAYVIFAVRADMPPKDSYQKAKAAALRALELDDTIAEAHTALGHVRCWYDWDWPGAESEFKRGIQRASSNPAQTQYYASYLITMGREQEAVSEITQAQRLSPLSLNLNVQVARILYFAGRFDEAIEQCRKTLNIEPNYGGAHLFLGRAYQQKGMFREGLAELDRARELLGGSEVLSLIGYADAASGRRLEALKILQDLQNQSKQIYVSPYHIAMIYAGLGDKDKAFACLEKAYEDREGRMTLLRCVPEFKSLRADPRYSNLVSRVGLKP